MKIEEVEKLVEQIIEKEGSKMSYEEFCKHPRYPYTWAWDFVRTHYTFFGFKEMPSRGEVSQFFKDSENKEEIAKILAEGYYRTVV